MFHFPTFPPFLAPDSRTMPRARRRRLQLGERRRAPTMAAPPLSLISIVQSRIDLVHIWDLCLRSERSGPTCSLITTILFNYLVCGLREPTCTWLSYGDACRRLSAVRHRLSSSRLELTGWVLATPPRGHGNAGRHLPRKRRASRC